MNGPRTVLVKTENGYQMVTIPAQGPTLTSGATIIRTPTPSGQQLMIPVSQLQQTLAAQAGGAKMVMSIANQPTSVMNTPQTLSGSLPVVVSGGSSQVPTNTQLTVQTSQANAQASSSSAAPSQMSPTTARKKCKNFLSTLIRLANDQPENVATNVKTLIQGLVVCILFFLWCMIFFTQHNQSLTHLHIDLHFKASFLGFLPQFLLCLITKIMYDHEQCFHCHTCHGILS